MPWLSDLPISEAQKIEGSTHHGHTSLRKLCFGANAPQHVVPARCRSRSHKANTSQAMSCLPTSLIISKVGVPAATQSRPPPALSSAHYTNVLYHPGSNDVRQSDHQGQLLRRNIQQPQLQALNRRNFETRWNFFKRVSGNKLWSMWNTSGQFLD